MTSVLVLFPMGGLNPRTQLHGDVLQDAGYNVKALCWNRGGGYEIEDNGPIPTEQVNITAGRGSFGNILVVPIVSLLFLVGIVRRRPDVIYCTHVSLLPAAVAGKFLARAQLVYDVQELFAVSYGGRDTTGAKQLATVATQLEMTLTKFVDGILTIDSRGGRLQARYGKYVANVETVYNVPELKPLPEGSSHDPVVVFIGTIVEERGVIKLARSVPEVRERVPGAKFRFVGPVRDDSQDRVESFLAGMGEEHAVEFLGKVPFETIHDHLAPAAVGAAPYQPVEKFRESRGNARKLFDYMNAGLPILGPGDGGIGDLIEELDCGVTVDTTDVTELADALVSLLTDDEYASQLGENGRKAVESRYNWDRERQKVTDVVDAALD